MTRAQWIVLVTLLALVVLLLGILVVILLRSPGIPAATTGAPTPVAPPIVQPTQGPTPTPSAFCGKDDIERYFKALNPIIDQDMRISGSRLGGPEATLVADLNELIDNLQAIWTPPCATEYTARLILANQLEIQSVFASLQRDYRLATSFESQVSDIWISLPALRAQITSQAQ
jgi:hypothetical protein